MKTLAERHIDRAQRKADNAAESNEQVSGGVGFAASAITTAEEAFNALTDEEKSELKGLMSDGFMSTKADAYGDAFDGKGSLKTAGIGVVNPLVSPGTAVDNVEGEAGTAGAGSVSGWGKAAESDLSAEGTNANGAALDAAGDDPKAAAKAKAAAAGNK